MSKIKVAIADDHQLFREGLAFILEKEEDFDVLFDAENGEDLLQKLQKSLEPADVILMDIKMPVMDGMEATQQIKKQYPKMKIISISMYDQEDFVLHLLDLGVNGYLLKETSAQEVKKAIRTVKDKGYYFDDFVSQIMLSGLKRKNRNKPNVDGHVQITTREKDVLKLILKECTNHEIAEKLFISVRTVETHRKNLLDKFRVRNTVGLVIRALELGILY